MKVLIWLGCFFVATVLNTLLGYVTGFKIGYVLFYFGVYFVAKELCDKWDQHKFKDKIVSYTEGQKTGVSTRTERGALVYVVGEDVFAGKHTFVATKPDGGLVHILSNENTIINRRFIKNKKTINLKLGTRIKLFDCVIDSVPVVEDEDSINENDVCFCRKCGEKLINNSRFCRKCGTEIVIVEED